MKIFNALLLFILLSSPALAQGLLTGPAPKSLLTAPEEKPAPQPPAQPAFQSSSALAPAAPGKGPLEITADETLEWHRNEKLFIARGQAQALQGDTAVNADTLSANYDEKKTGGGMKISKVNADGNVVITSREAKAYGEKADYDLDKGYALMTGGNLRLETKDQVVTARERFEYEVAAGRLTAVGDAKVKRIDDTLRADKISAVMKNNEKGQRVLDTLEARDNVVITTPTEVVTGSYAIYRAATNKAEMTGGVKITRGPNVLEGQRAEVDLATNVSRIFGNGPGTGRVKGVFYPDSAKELEKDKKVQ
ncbi:MAG: ostA-like family protein [Alphaproteobacteria bacterium]|nr:ostA-like family protein [Alphaproteobacteria bacterium]